LKSGIKSENKPILLISASDSSAAAGMQVDLRVLNNLGAPARCAITAVTIQGDEGAKIVDPVDPDLIIESIRTALSDSPGIGAVKIGLLADAPTAEILEEPFTVIEALEIPIVVDPVMRSTPGSALSKEDTAKCILEKILPRTSLITPNRDELDVFGSLMGAQGSDEVAKIEKLFETGVAAILVTGGDTDKDECIDTLYEASGIATEFIHPRIGRMEPRGTGCALSTAIAIHLSRRMELRDAVGWSIDYVTGLIEGAGMVGEQLLLLPGKES